MQVGGKYNWKGQPERLVYLGHKWIGNGYWHQFAKVESPGVVWCEVLDDQLDSFEETVSHRPSCAYCEQQDDAWTAKDLARGKRGMKPGPGVEYHCMNAFYGAQ